MFGPEKNATLSSGVGSDDDHPCPVIVRACWSWTNSPPAQGVFLQWWEGADQVWGAVQVVAAMTGEWAVKPWGYRFMGHLVLSKVKGQGCMTCPTLYYSTIRGEPWTVQPASNYSRTECDSGCCYSDAGSLFECVRLKIIHRCLQIVVHTLVHCQRPLFLLCNFIPDIWTSKTSSTALMNL